MVDIILTDKDIYVSCYGGEWQVYPLTNGWLWVLGSLREGNKIDVTDDRKNLLPHQNRLGFTYNAETGDMELKKGEQE